MPRRDLTKTLRTLLIEEVRRDRPSFAVIDRLEEALKQSLRRDNELSVDDVDGRRKGFSSGITIEGGFIYGDDDDCCEKAAHPLRRRESERDQMLSALDQMVARTGADPLVAVVQAIPHLDKLYPDEVDRYVVVRHMRDEIGRRLGVERDDAEPDEEREEVAS